MKKLLFLCLLFASAYAVADTTWTIGGRSSGGGVIPVEIDSNGNLGVNPLLLSGEDQTNDVLKTEPQYNVCIDDADIVCKSSEGYVYSVWCFDEDNSPTAGSVRLKNATSAAGGEATEVWGYDFTTSASGHVGAVLGIIMDTGIVIDFTTTADVKCGVSYR